MSRILIESHRKGHLRCCWTQMTYDQISHDMFPGIGHGMVIMTGIVAIYYNVILSWAIYYFAMSFASELPWSTCNNDWNTDNCYLRIMSNTSSVENQTNLLSQSYYSLNNTDTPLVNITMTSNVVSNTTTRRTPTEEFWE